MSDGNPFSQVASGYAEHRPSYPEPLFEWLATKSPGNALAWDCGSGSGQAAEGLSTHFRHVCACDISFAQLYEYRHSANVTKIQSGAERVPLNDNSADLVTVAQALHWFHLPDFYQEVIRLLRGGGLLAVWSYNLLQINDAVDEVVHRLYYDILGGYWDPARKLVESGYADIPFPFEELKTPSFAMKAQWGLDRLVGYLETWSALAHYRNRTGLDPMPEIVEQLRKAWGANEHSMLVQWPLSFRVGRTS